jgi:3-oxoacyl-[acyl-carrier-protein] synthase II
MKGAAGRNGSIGAGRGSSAAIRSAIELVIKDAGIEPTEIGLVVSHACGDPESDAAERAALLATLPDQPVVAPMASLGHTGAASGSIELATAVLSLVHQTLPPTIRVKSTSDQIRFLDQPAPFQGDYALSLTYTSEGNATALLLRRC